MIGKCALCGGTLSRADDIVCEFPEGAIVTAGYRCVACGEEIFDGADIDRLIGAARKIGAWGGKTTLRRKLSRSGRGTILRIPVDLERALAIKGDETVDIEVMGKKRFVVQVV